MTRKREWVDVLANALFKDAVYLFVCLLEIFRAALLIEINAEQALNDGVERAVIALGVDIPAVERAAVKFVGVLDMLDKRIPVKRNTKLLLEELDGGLNLVNAKLLGRGIIVHKRRCERMNRFFAVV